VTLTAPPIQRITRRLLARYKFTLRPTSFQYLFSQSVSQYALFSGTTYVAE